MQPKFLPPAFNEKAFHCPICQVYAAQIWQTLKMNRDAGWQDAPVHAAKCSYCKNYHYWFSPSNGQPRMFEPESSMAPPFHPMMPDPIQADYIEAAAVLQRSPRSAAALLRLAVQKLLIELKVPGKTIDAQVKALVADGLSPLVQQALDVCRVVGNEAVHPGELDLNDTPELAANLFVMVNYIVAERIERPAHIAELYGRIPAEKREWIEQRDKGAKPLAPTLPDARGPAESPTPQG